MVQFYFFFAQSHTAGHCGAATTWLAPSGAVIGNKCTATVQIVGDAGGESGAANVGQRMSDTDSFIEEVTEEVRRDRLFAMFRRYAPYAAAAIILLVGGAAWNEYRKASEIAAAQQLGDSIIAALQDHDDPAARVAALQEIAAPTSGGKAVIGFMAAAGKAQMGEHDAAVARLSQIATDGELPDIYRQIATFKLLTLQAETLPAADRRLQFEALAQPGNALRLLAEEQLALIDAAGGDGEAAVTRLQAILDDAEATGPLRERATQLIVALGGALDEAASQG